MKPCVFCGGLRGELALQTVYEDREVVAFLDHRPLFPGHVLLIPRRHVEQLDALRVSEMTPLFERLRVLVRSVPRALQAQGAFVANNNKVSQSVPHLHFHVVPRSKGDGLKGFFWPRVPYRDEAHAEEVRLRIEECTWQESILDFWIGPLDESGWVPPEQARHWFAQDAEFDRQIALRFGSLVERALLGQLASWEQEPRGALALLILLDQFTRNLFRHTGRAFAGDERAQQLAWKLRQQGLDRQLALPERIFTYLPFEHGESHEWQQRSLEAFQELAGADAERCQGFLDYAERHARVIERFGRYPHRNQALGRTSTPEEEAFLSQPGSSFW